MDAIAMITGIKTAIDLATTIRDVTKDIELKAKAIELHDSIISLQTNIMSVQTENHSLLEENQLLRKEIIKIEAWEQEKTKYSLLEICPQVFVYASNTTDNDSDPAHWICQNCYNNDTKSILQCSKKTSKGTFYICHNCNSEICDHVIGPKIRNLKF